MSDLTSSPPSTAPVATRGLIIAAPGTRSGKTTLTLGLLRALHRQGLNVAPYKIGPDYIDPKYHEAASGQPCFNLDGWAMRPSLLAHLLTRGRGMDLCIAEGVMGLFDGAATTGINGNGSTADLARLTGWPVLLVINCAGMGQSVGAVLRGFAAHDSQIRLAGVIANNVASPRHRAVLAEGLASTAVPVLGFLPTDAALRLPSRHLGLHQACEHSDLEQLIGHAAELVARHCDLSAILSSAGTSSLPSSAAATSPTATALPPLGQRIAIARDAAFGFAYNHLLTHWRRQGAEILPFSPLADEAPADDADAIYLPGGYPELHANRLANARHFLGALQEQARRGTLIYGECGGYMVLGEGIEDAAGKRHAMANLLPLQTSFRKRRLHLGYRRLSCPSPFAGLDTTTRYTAHEFHYATITSQGSAPALFIEHDSRRPVGLCIGRVAGSFMHLIDRVP